MPAIQFQDPRLFGGFGQAVMSGIGQGVQAGGELQQQRQLAAMAPIQVQEAQQQAELTRRQLMQPPLIKMGEELKNVPNPDANVNPDDYKDAIAQGMTPEKAREAATVPEDQQVSDQYKIEHYRNALTGEVVSIPSLFKSAEQVNLEREQAHRYGMMGQYYAGRNTATNLNAEIRAGGKPQSALQDDGHLHFVTRQLNPDTQQMEDVVGGIDQDTESKILKNQATAARDQAQAKKTTSIPLSEYQARKASDESIKLGLGSDPELYSTLSSTEEGDAALTELRAIKANAEKVGVTKPLSPAAALIIKKTRDAIAANKTQGPASVKNPIANPSKDDYDSLNKGDPFTYNGTLHHKGVD